MFELFEREGAKGIRLKEGIDALQLWNRFCLSLSLKVIRAFRAETTKEVLGV